MKVFISHSSRDRWIANRILKDLHELGVETFLDEKDLETGDEIDDILDVHLKPCDELLVLLSPTSVKSPWVLIEVGAARALGKRLVPVLLHVGSNEIPSPISNKLAIDINNIDKYYDEVTARMKGKKPAKRHRKVRVKEHEIEVGDVVRFKLTRPKDYHTGTSYIVWTDEDDKLLGTTATVTRVREDGVFNIDSLSEDNLFCPPWVTLVKKANA